MSRAASRKLLSAWLREVGVQYLLRPSRPAAEGARRPAVPPDAGPGTETLDDIRRELEGCRGCPLCAGRSTIVFGTGNPRARLMFVGEGPGVDEDRQGEPFVGAAGKRLNQWIARIGLRREDVYIANIVKCRPPRNRDPEPDEIDTCSPFLVEQIRAIRPRVIVTLGSPATKRLLGTRLGITRLRGHWHAYRGIPVMPTTSAPPVSLIFRASSRA